MKIPANGRRGRVGRSVLSRVLFATNSVGTSPVRWRFTTGVPRKCRRDWREKTTRNRETTVANGEARNVRADIKYPRKPEQGENATFLSKHVRYSLFGWRATSVCARARVESTAIRTEGETVKTSGSRARIYLRSLRRVFLRVHTRVDCIV